MHDSFNGEAADPPGITSPLLECLPGIGHRFLGRQGGVSAAPYDSLNASFYCGDEAQSVSENRRRISRLAADRPLAIPRQVHECSVWQVREAPASPESAPQADVLITTEPTLALGILTADCVPVLLADPGACVIAAAHAGWRGALAGVTDAALDALTEAGAEPARVHAALGPAIQQISYPVSSELEQQFLSESPFDCRPCFTHINGAVHFDLPHYVELRLRQRGLTRIDRLRQDTATQTKTFFSHRAEGPATGRQLSMIWLAD